MSNTSWARVSQKMRSAALASRYTPYYTTSHTPTLPSHTEGSQ